MGATPSVITLCSMCGRLWEPHRELWSRPATWRLQETLIGWPFPRILELPPEVCAACRSYLSNYPHNIPRVKSCPCCTLSPRDLQWLKFTHWRVRGYYGNYLGSPLSVEQIIKLAEYDLLLSG